MQVVGEGRTLTLVLDSALPKIPRDNDRAFVQALCYGVLRWYYRLDRVLARLTHRPLKDLEVRLLALLGLYQLKYTRVKAHAAVAETVAAARAKSWAKPLLNAVLRGYQREQSRIDAEVETDVVAALAHPAWMVRAFEQDWPDHGLDLLRANNEPPPLILRVNRLVTTRTDYLARLAVAGIPSRAAEAGDSAVVVETPVPVERLPDFAGGAVSVQDAAAQLAAPLLDLRPGQRVLDLCAAPGGKTAHILESCPELRELVAVDIAPERVARIRENLARAGLTATIIAGDAAAPEPWWDGEPFDRILVDAPCSATGVIRRHPDIKLLRQPEDVAELAALQARILESAWRLLAPDGRLVYATCSVFRQENEATIGRFLDAHREARERPVDLPFGIPVRHGRQILTGEAGMDGFYYACLERRSPCCVA